MLLALRKLMMEQVIYEITVQAAIGLEERNAGDVWIPDI